MIKWIGTIASILGSFMVAFGMILPGYALFLIGSAAWLYIALITRDKALGALNATFFVANIIGFIRSF